MVTDSEITEFFSRRLTQAEVKSVAEWAADDTDRFGLIFKLAGEGGRNSRVGINALWCLTHMQKHEAELIQTRQCDLIDMLLAETHIGRKRMLLQLLRAQTYDKATLRADFLDYCLSKITSECEPYAIRAFSIYCAFKMCRFFPDLTVELSETLDMLEQQSELSPGLKSALRNTRRQINRLAH